MKYDTVRAEIELIDVNDNIPQFEVDIYNISIVENLPNGFSVLQVVATDQDQVCSLLRVPRKFVRGCEVLI